MQNTTKPLSILISGAGPAGLSVAYWLKKYGFSPTIIERSPTLQTGGYKIDIRGAALNVLHKMGIYDEVVNASTDMQGAKLIDKNGKTIHEMSGNDFGHRMGDDQEIMRGKLCEILKDSIPDVEIIFGDAIQSIAQTKDSVYVEFKKSFPRHFDLVIGADGLHSNVRKMVFGDEKSFIRKFGIYLSVFTIPNYLNLDRMEIQYTEFGRVVAIWSIRGENDARVSFAFVSPKEIDHHNLEDQQQLIRTVFQDIGWEVPQFLQLMHSAPDFYFDSAAQICMDKWSSNRVVLLGDAAYCPSPMSGQGTSLALIGSYVLAGELANAKGDYQTAFQQFDLEMRPFIQVNQALGVTAAELFKSQEKKNFITWILMKVLHHIPGKILTFFINRSTRRIHQAANAIQLKDY